MNCAIHSDKEANGACVYCGKLFCSDCLIGIDGKNYCKNCVNRVFDEKEQKLNKLTNNNNTNAPSPMVFMNAGGGGGGSSSSSSSSSAAAAGASDYDRRPPYPVNSVLIHIILFFCTAGLGNIAYYLYIRQKQQQWHMMQ